MHNDVMSAATDMQWIQQQIMYQVDAVVENLATNNPAKLLQHSQFIVSSIVDKMDVKHALGMYYHMAEQAAHKDTWASSPDRLQCVYDHFNQWVELELAKRYA